VGKTTLLNTILADKKSIILNCEKTVINEVLENKNIPGIKQLTGEKAIVVFDEAQKVHQIGELLKILYDENSLAGKIIATGSSSFELAGKITEPLTGRNRKLKLLPVSLNEIKMKDGWLWIEENLESLLLFGQYPAVLTAPESRKERNNFERAGIGLFI